MLSWWLRAVGQLLSLDHYLLPPRAPPQPPQRPPPPQLPVLAAIAEPTSLQTPEAPEYAGRTSNEQHPLAEEEARPEQDTTAQQSLSAVDSHAVCQTAGRRHCLRVQHLSTGSEDSAGFIGGLPESHASELTGPSSSSAQPQALQASAPTSADLASVTDEDRWQLLHNLPEAMSHASSMHGSQLKHALVSGFNQAAKDSQQGIHSSADTSCQQDEHSDGSASPITEHHVGSRLQPVSQSSTQPGPSTQADEPAESSHQGDVFELSRKARKWSDGFSQAPPTSLQSGVAPASEAGHLPSPAAQIPPVDRAHDDGFSQMPRTATQSGAASASAFEAGHMPSPAAQTPPVDRRHEAGATTEGLVANIQLGVDDEPPPSQLMVVGVLLMLTLLLFMTGALTLPCVIGNQHPSVPSLCICERQACIMLLGFFW